MTNAFITNDGEKKLANRIKTLCAMSDRFDMLVGYFYFSAIGAIADAMFADDGRTIRVLVGMDAESGTGGAVALGLAEAEGGSNEEKRAAFYKSVEATLKNPALDKKAFFDRLEHVIDWIAKGRLEIRKTARPNHSKLYIFQMDAAHKELVDRVFITGSSNFSEPGLKLRDEFNVEIKDYGTDEAQKYFDDLWAEALPLTKDEEQKQLIIDILKRNTQMVTPYEAYLRVLKAYIEYQEGTLNTTKVEALLKKAGFNRYSYQVDAVAQAMKKLENYGGVIVADVVGLGKSIIGALIGALSGKRGMVICPPGLVGEATGEAGGWNGYLKSFGLDETGWRAMSRGDLGAVKAAMKGANYEMVIVDEAHYYRSRGTAGYEELHEICAGKDVVLLSATPFNNRPNDLLAMILLFSDAMNSPFVKSGRIEDEFRVMDERFRNLGRLKRLVAHGTLDEIEHAATKCGITLSAAKGGTTKAAYGEAAGKELAKLTAVMRSVMEQIVIRRNRIDIEKTPHYQAEIGDISKAQPPNAQHFELTDAQNDFYDRVIKEYFGDEQGTRHFHGAVYRPDFYVKDAGGKAAKEYQENVYKMIRMRLVLRFESSFGAFRQSLVNVLGMLTKTKAFIAKTHGAIYYNKKIMEKILALDEETDIDGELDKLIEADQQRLEGGCRRNGALKAEYNIHSESFDGKRYDKEFDEDQQLIEDIIAEIDTLKLVEEDPKAAALVKAVKKVLKGTHGDVETAADEPKRKILIFTGFTDTMNHVKKYLEEEFPGRVLAVSGGNYGKKMAMTVRRNFDASAPEQTDDYDILLATDKLSEGFNLNRAGLAVNYDIPWNPTRVIQRVGRINRIGKMVFRNLYIFNFFPTKKGSTVAQNREIAENKMMAIHNILHEDVQIFSADEEPTPSELYNKLTSLDDEEELSFYTKVKGEYIDGLKWLKKNAPEIYERLMKSVPRVKSAFAAKPNATYMFAKRGPSLFASRYNPGDGTIDDASLEEAIAALKCGRKTTMAPLSADFWDYRKPGEKTNTEGVYTKLMKAMAKGSGSAGKAKVTAATIAAARLTEALAQFSDAEQDFVRDLIYDLRYIGSLSPRVIGRLANSKLTADELRDEILKVEADFGEDYFREKRAKSGRLEIIATVQRV